MMYSKIEGHDKRYTQKIDTQIRHSLIQYLRKCTHPRQYRYGSYLSQQQQKKATENSYQLYGTDGIVYTCHPAVRYGWK